MSWISFIKKHGNWLHLGFRFHELQDRITTPADRTRQVHSTESKKTSSEIRFHFGVSVSWFFVLEQIVFAAHTNTHLD